MILQQAMMQLSQSKEKKVSKLVMLSEYGLAMHKGVGVLSSTWTISHYNSGKSVLSYIKERKDVEEYIEKLVEICEKWDFTLQEFDESEWKHDLKREVDKLQKEITEGK